MSLPHFCIKNPVFTIVINLLIVMIGVICFQRLSVSGYPSIENPTIGIHTTLTGASADYMQDQVSRPIENAVSTITGIDTIESSSQQGVSDVVLMFENGVNLNVKMNEISNAIAQISSQLPANISSPEIHQDNPNSSPIISLFFYDANRSRPALSDYLSRYVEPRLEKIQGVGTVNLAGSRDYAIRIWLDPAKMATLHVDVDDVIDALSEQNIQGASGKLRTPERDYPLVPDARVKRVSDFNNLIIRPYKHIEAESDGTTTATSNTTTSNSTTTENSSSNTQESPQAVLFKDIGSITLGTDNVESAAYLNGHPGVAISIVTASDANPLQVAKRIHAVMNQIQSSLPDGMHVKIGYDLTQFLQGSIDSVYETLIIALILIVVVILLFLGSIRTSIIPMITVPMYVFRPLYNFHSFIQP
ncbi:MAG: efflux RND transporter permease subunit [Gammaproteobacteria bacterium]|nr:efflux RND transporter permease subunit [Gammaproteobacteria bacterium]